MRIFFSLRFSALFLHLFAYACLAGVLSASELPSFNFEDDFENHVPGPIAEKSGAWHVDGTGSAFIAADVEGGSSQALLLSNELGQLSSVTLLLESGFELVAWTDFEARLAPYASDEPPPKVPADVNICFYLSSDGDLHVYDGSAWRCFQTGFDATLPHRFTIRRDYLMRIWNIWVDGEPLETPNPALAFNSASTQNASTLFRILASEQQSVWLDDVEFRRTAPEDIVGIGRYSDWRDAIDWEPTDDPNPGGDPNANGWINLMEYFFNLPNPSGPAPTYAPHFRLGPGFDVVQFSFRRNLDAEDLEWRLMGSSDLEEWEPLVLEESAVQVSPIDPHTQEITISVPMESDAAFFAIDVVQP